MKTMLRTWRAVLGALAATTLLLTGCGGGGSSTPAIPAAPTGVTATPGDTQVTLAWTAVSGATSYNIYYGTSAGVTPAGVTTAAAGTLLSDVTSPAVVPDLTNDTTYYFIVTAVNAGGESDPSAEVSAVPSATPAPAAPTGLSAAPGDTQVTLAWTSVSGATSYNVYYGTSSGVTTATGTLLSGVTSPYDVTGLTNDTTYYFIVTAVNANGESTASPEVSATPAVVPAPAAPTGVTATPGDGMVTLAWTDVTGATSYNVYYGTSAGVTTATGTLISDVANPLEVTSLTNGTTYYFIVTAANTGGESDASTEVSATPSPAPFIAATVLSLAGGSNPLGWLQQVEVCTDGTCNTPITDATVTVNSTTLTYNASDEAYEGSATIAAGGAVALTVTVDGIDYTASGTQFTSFPTISAPLPNASWAADSAHDITWSGGLPTTGAAYVVGIFDDTGNLAYPGGDGPKEVATSTNSDTVPADTLAAGDYSVLVGIGTEGIADNSGGIAIAGAASGSGMWIGGIAQLVPITVTAPQPQGPFINALVLSLEGGINYLPFLEQVEVCTDATCNTPVTDATVKVNGTTLTYNSGDEAYEGSVTVAKGAAVTVSVTTSAGYTYTASGTQFTTFPAITAPTNGATWTATNANTISWTAGLPTSDAVYAVGVIDSDGNFDYPGGGLDSGPKAVPIGTTTDIVPANTLTSGNYVVLVGIGTAGITDNTGGLPFANTVSGSGLWIGGLASFVIVTVP